MAEDESVQRRQRQMVRSVEVTVCEPVDIVVDLEDAKGLRTLRDEGVAAVGGREHHYTPPVPS